MNNPPNVKTSDYLGGRTELRVSFEWRGIKLHWRDDSSSFRGCNPDMGLTLEVYPIGLDWRGRITLDGQPSPAVAGADPLLALNHAAAWQLARIEGMATFLRQEKL